MERMGVSGKVVLITGGGRGIGAATAMIFASAGAKVAVLARTKSEVEDTVREIEKSGGVARGFVADVRKEKDIKGVVHKVLLEFGRIDILINNAAIIHWKEFLDQNKKYWEEEIDINLGGVLVCSKIVAQLMIKQRDGVIINISSGAGKTGYPRMAVYSATKFAVLGFTQGFSQEVKQYNVRVYAVCPGSTRTQMTGFTGMLPEKVAKRILEAAEERLGLEPGGDTEIYY